jgi:hypothetical protein
MRTFFVSFVIGLMSIVAVCVPSVAVAQAFTPGAVAQVNAVYDTSVVISGTVTDPSVLSVFITYGSSDLSPGGEVTAPIDDRGRFSIEITGLEPSTRYLFQVIDLDTNRELTPSFSFTTKSILFGFTISKVTETSAQLFGTVATARPDLRVLWGEASLTGFQHGFNPTIQGNRTFNETLVDLLPNTEYKVTLVKASDEKARLSGIYSFRTLGINASPYMGRVRSEDAIINVRLPRDLAEVYVYYGTSQNELSRQARMTEEDPGLYTTELTGLAPDTLYHYRIVGRDDTGAPVIYGNISVIGTDVDGRPILFGSMFSFRTPIKNTPVVVRTIVDTVGSLVGGTTEKYEGGLIPCSGVDDAGNVTCGFSDFLKMINTIIGFIVFYLVPAIATIIIMIAGFQMLTSGGNPAKITAAKGLLRNAVTGVLIITGAWLIIKSVLVGIGYDTSIFPDVLKN